MNFDHDGTKEIWHDGIRSAAHATNSFLLALFELYGSILSLYRRVFLFSADYLDR